MLSPCSVSDPQTLLNPLYSGGLWLPVIITAPLAQYLNASGAVMITGSHNPPEYNGFKSVCGSDTLHGESIQEVYRIIERNDFERGSGALAEVDVVTPYVDEIASQFHFD